MQVSIFITFIFLTGNALAQKHVLFSEAYIKKAITQNPPSIQQIEASYLTVKKQELTARDNYSWKLEGESTYNKSDEILLNNFDGGVTRSSSIYSLGIVKPTSYGIDLEIKAFGNKVSNAFINDATTAGVAVGLSMDLFQNFLGRKSANELERNILTSERAKLEKKISVKTFESNMRKLYWALVANSEQKKLLESLVGHAHTQYKEAVRRKKAGVADSGEVARYRSQWTTRKASLLSLEYRKGEISKSIKEFLPDLNGKEILLDNYSVERTITDVLACSSMISYYKTTPFQFTPYDEIVSSLNSEERLEQKVARTYDDPTVELFGEYSSVGRGFGYGSARDNYDDNKKPRSSIGLKISIPFGGTKSDTRDVTEKLAKNSFRAKSRGNLSRIKSFHSETAKIIGILQQVVKNQKETNKYLTRSLKVSRKKYKQARISVQELISEQDSHLQSRLNEIDTNLTIINTLLDYFSIYTDMPCKINR